MKRLSLIIIIMVVSLAPSIRARPLTISADSQGREYAAGELVAKLKPGVRLSSAKARSGLCATDLPKVDVLNKRYACTRMERLLPPCRVGSLGAGLDRLVVVELDPTIDIPAAVQAYEATGMFEYVEPNWISRAQGLAKACVTPNDEFYYSQWALNNNGIYNENGLFQVKADADIDMPEAWEIEKGDSSIIVSILDSGCKMNHPDLAGRFWTNTGEIPGNGIDDEGDGYVDDVHGYDFVNGDSDPTDDDNIGGHGTSIAGIIAARANNAIGFTGVDWRCKIMICKFSDSLGRGRSSDIVAGINYAVQHGGKVINMSFGCTQTQAIDDAVQQAVSSGVICVVSVGNEGIGSISYPARRADVLSVGATTAQDERLISTGSTSNYGPEIDVVAPGAYIFSICNFPVEPYNRYSSGTSNSAPFVAGLASLLLAQRPTRTPAELTQIICETAEDQVGTPGEDTPGWDQYYGHGRINAYQALLRGQMAARNAASRHRAVVRNVRLAGNNAVFDTHVSYVSMYRINGSKIAQSTSTGTNGPVIALGSTAHGLAIYRATSATGTHTGTMIR